MEVPGSWWLIDSDEDEVIIHTMITNAASVTVANGQDMETAINAMTKRPWEYYAVFTSSSKPSGEMRGSAAQSAPNLGGFEFPVIKEAKRVVLVRHGESTWNATGRIQGSSDFSVLTAKGESQAETSRQMLAADSFDVCFHSPLQRSARTAEVIWAARTAPMIPLHDLREIDLYSFQGTARFGENYRMWQKDVANLEIDGHRPGLFKEEGKARFGENYRMWQKDAANFEIDGHYPVRELWARAAACWQEILRSEGRSVLVVAHNAVNQALVATATGDPEERGSLRAGGGAQCRQPGSHSDCHRSLVATATGGVCLRVGWCMCVRGRDSSSVLAGNPEERGALRAGGGTLCCEPGASGHCHRPLSRLFPPLAVEQLRRLGPEYFRLLLQSNCGVSVLDFVPHYKPHARTHTPDDATPAPPVITGGVSGGRKAKARVILVHAGGGADAQDSHTNSSPPHSPQARKTAELLLDMRVGTTPAPPVMTGGASGRREEGQGSSDPRVPRRHQQLGTAPLPPVPFGTAELAGRDSCTARDGFRWEEGQGASHSRVPRRHQQLSTAPLPQSPFEQLSMLGVVQARKTAELLLDLRVDTVFCSPLPRAVRTAEAVVEVQEAAECLGADCVPRFVDVVPVEELRELEYGTWQVSWSTAHGSRLKGCAALWGTVESAQRLCCAVGNFGSKAVLRCGELLSRLKGCAALWGTVESAQRLRLKGCAQGGVPLSSKAVRAAEAVVEVHEVAECLGWAPTVCHDATARDWVPRFVDEEALEKLTVLDHGAWQGAMMAEVSAQERWEDQLRSSPPPNGESLPSLWGRAEKAWTVIRRHLAEVERATSASAGADVAAAGPGSPPIERSETVIVVGHETVFQAMLASCLKLPHDALGSFRLDPGSITVVDFPDGVGEPKESSESDNKGNSAAGAGAAGRGIAAGVVGQGVVRCINYTAHLGRWAVPVTLPTSNDEDF
ncbi:unnamed protein product [Closterium sp. NIES-64]|nr:unnamed protein product [Closterium sp. NIES-64]